MWYREIADKPPPLVDRHNDQCTTPTMEANGTALLERNGASWIWVIPACPYCGQEHHHYGGSLDEDPYHYTGYLVPARCTFTEYIGDQHHTPVAARTYHLVPARMRLQRRSLERQARTKEHTWEHHAS
jgi:hypothetical protein